MRWVFFSLIFLNIIFVGWQISTKPADKDIEVPVAGDHSVPMIKLLEEGESQAKLKSKKVKPKPKPAKSESTEAVKTVNLVSENVSDKPVLCDAFGPYLDRREASELVAELRVKEMLSSVHQENVLKNSTFWVYMQPQETLRAAQVLIEKLKAEEIDSALIDEGELLNGLSLGEFEKIVQAVNLVERLKVLSVDANIQAKSKSYDQFWVLLNKQESLKIDDELLNSLQETLVGAQRHEKVCKPVAS